jgi:hypothetical protein
MNPSANLTLWHTRAQGPSLDSRVASLARKSFTSIPVNAARRHVRSLVPRASSKPMRELPQWALRAPRTSGT